MAVDERVRLAAVTTSLHWEHRRITSGDRFDLAVARDYSERHVALQLRLMEEAAACGADLVTAPEYFAGSELFTTTTANRRRFVDDVADSPTVRRLCELSRRRGVHLACAMAMFHGDRVIQTGILTQRDGTVATLQVKNTCLKPAAHGRHHYALRDLDIGRTAIMTCSDCTTYPEDGLALARQGLALLLVPGCGFGPPAYLTTKPADLGCVLVHADSGRGMIVDSTGRVQAETHTPDRIVYADVRVPVKTPATPGTRLRWGVN